MMMMFYALIALCVTGSTLAQRLRWGPCPEVKPMPTFELSKMEGKWFEARRYFTIPEFSAKCVTADFWMCESRTMWMNISAISSFTGREYRLSEIPVRSPYHADRGMLKIKTPDVPLAIPPYLVLGTDYVSYVAIYSCMNWELFHLQLLWIGTREQQPTNAIVNKAIKVIKQRKLNVKDLMKTEQRYCELDNYEQEIEEPSCPCS